MKQHLLASSVVVGTYNFMIGNPNNCGAWVVVLSDPVMEYTETLMNEHPLYTEWFKKMDPISYVSVSWTVHGT
jgi:DUF2075 family protein